MEERRDAPDLGIQIGFRVGIEDADEFVASDEDRLSGRRKPRSDATRLWAVASHDTSAVGPKALQGRACACASHLQRRVACKRAGPTVP